MVAVRVVFTRIYLGPGPGQLQEYHSATFPTVRQARYFIRTMGEGRFHHDPYGNPVWDRSPRLAH